MLLLMASAASPVDGERAIVAGVVAPCRKGKTDEIVVCAHDHEERSPYRLPVIANEDGFQIDGPVDSVSRSRHKLMDVGGAGAQAGACGASGAGGQAGCMVKAWKEADEQAGFPNGIHLGPR